MKTLDYLQNTAVILSAFLLISIFFSGISKAYATATTYNEENLSVYELWTIDEDYCTSLDLRNLLRNEGYVSEKVDDNELDYLITLAQHLSTYYDNVNPALCLAVIAVESGFDVNAVSSSGARGLMQLSAYFHSDRLMQFIEDDEKYSDSLFFDPRLNIMTGLDYLSYAIEDTKGDIAFSLMWYNQGPASAYNTYVEKGVTSSYAKKVIKLSNKITDILDN